MIRRDGGDLLVRLLLAHGVDTAFGVVSVHNLPLVEALDRELTFVPVRHEAAAVNAADGYARAGAPFGVAITSTGTGAGNAAGALVEAQTAGSRVLHVTGQVEREFLGSGRGVIHETKDQLGMLRAVSRHAATVLATADAQEVLCEAIRSVLTVPHGPSSVEWPIDLQYAVHDMPSPPRRVSVPGTHPVDRADVESGARLIAGARRPLIWAGGGATAAGDQVRRLAERCGAGILTSNSGRGTVAEDHELVIGNFATDPEARDLISSADLLLVVGTHFRSNETAHYSLPLPECQVQIDIDRDTVGRVYPAAAGIVADARPALTEIGLAVAELGSATESGWRDRVVATRNRVRARLGAAIGPYLPICRSLRSLLPRRSVVARDVTIPSSMWGNRLLEMYESSSNVFPVGGGIGQGLAMGLGAAAARPEEPTVVLAGDGGLAVHLGELATLAGERPWLVLLVFNDGGYGVLRNMQDHHADRRSGVDLFTPDFSRLAAGMDLPYQLVQASGQFEEAFAKALDERGPHLIEVDVTALEPLPEPFVPPVHVPSS